MTTLTDKKRNTETDAEIVAYRYVEAGNTSPLANSYSEEMDCELDGVCCWETIEQVLDYAKWSDGRILEVAGDLDSYGALDGEVIVSNPVILREWSRKSMKDSWE